MYINCTSREPELKGTGRGEGLNSIPPFFVLFQKENFGRVEGSGILLKIAKNLPQPKRSYTVKEYRIG